MIPEFIVRQSPALQARARVAADSLLALTDIVTHDSTAMRRAQQICDNYLRAT